MAYNSRFNPDRLPAHAEPEQAAALLAGGGRDSARPPRTSSARPDYSNTPPPASRPDDRYGRTHSNSYSSYDSRPPPGAYGAPDPRYDARPRYDAQPRRDNPPPLRDPRYDGYGSPPPQNYGQGPPPLGHHGRPAIQQRPPPTPAPPLPRDGNDREALRRTFDSVDRDGNRSLTEEELRAALVNGDWTPFDPHTVRMMIRMFDTDRSGSINFEEFCGLWGFLTAWRKLFDKFDTDHSGSISYSEFYEAVKAFGYSLSDQFVQLFYSTYDRRGNNNMSFDLFVQACISLKRMTDVFKKYDDDRDGYITLSFEEFLTGAQTLFLFNSISAATDTGLY
ncbi:EF-hand [Bimuria novae-zelandiae CBS 107.79]|uniref:EF-hand n=1 Tax=Bimuria novae-zelandiae CBS 107.79 TaxID=1447943 RepID=A0A6A5VFD6_9PLEO|nr:EF-hand [Bimuria novae-zelandiae CBS 107.79]